MLDKPDLQILATSAKDGKWRVCLQHGNCLSFGVVFANPPGVLLRCLLRRGQELWLSVPNERKKEKLSNDASHDAFVRAFAIFQLYDVSGRNPSSERVQPSCRCCHGVLRQQ